ncbi:type II secretion system F family protein [Candidatus Woesearchaeota archaeon]|jgi:pilus assembly protein TadC|nr:type II secretion system F family protein [Candidatus Woesearchaeota archaeon]MBT4321755.1 type II secretion system F family protein [Candidatus Woesearchaeota archaeon]MBT4631153.1 type II secretion system F family protein [Candidatus Woesearchaeota archaeon]
MILIPYSFLPPTILRKISRIFFWLGKRIEGKFPNLNLNLEQIDYKISAKEYISMSITSVVILFLFLVGLSIPFSLKYGTNPLLSIFIISIISLFIFAQQILYPKLKANKRIKDIERNIIPALQNMVVQLNSGVPLFNVIAIVADSDYGGVSNQFRIAIRKMNAGQPQISVLEEIAKNNPSLHFRRVIWQIINGMKTGSNMADVIKISIGNLSEEQLIQIQRYGSQLNPLAMFYMIVAVIIPALGTTLIMVMSSFMGLSVNATKLIFWGLLAVVFFFQLMFIGMLKSRRPNLLD